MNQPPEYFDENGRLKPIGARNTCKEVVAPGIWIDIEGGVHFSITDLMEMFELPDTPENRAQVTETIKEILLRAHATESIIVERHKATD